MEDSPLCQDPHCHSGPTRCSLPLYDLVTSMSTLWEIVWLRMLVSAFPVDYPLGGEQMTSSANAVRRSKAYSQRDIPEQSNVHREDAYL